MLFINNNNDDTIMGICTIILTLLPHLFGFIKVNQYQSYECWLLSLNLDPIFQWKCFQQALDEDWTTLINTQIMLINID